MSQTPAPAGTVSELLQQLKPNPNSGIVFPGQGSQNAGMGREVSGSSATATAIYDAADRITGTSISTLCFDGPQDTLTATENAQPAILATSLAILAAAIETGAISTRPAYMAGHSLGEYSALVAAGAIDLDDALALVHERGRLMAEVGKELGGTMAAVVGLDEDAVIAVCEESGAEVANYNAPGQIVIGGRVASVKHACALAKERGGRGIAINVSGAFHTSLMDSAAERFAPRIEQAAIRDPQIPVIGNVSAQPLTTVEEVRADLAAQVRSPVRWYQSMDHLQIMGVTEVVEIGPGRVLTAQLKRSHPAMTSISLDEAEALRSAASV
ncbi:MAG: ACP S-malonyltransferase [Dehalococcoidia bacterium]